jgi:hypothetical protein
MSNTEKTAPQSAADLVSLMNRKAPELLDLLTADDETAFEQAFTTFLDAAIRKLETNKKLFKKLDEEGLSAVFSAELGAPGMNITQETHSNGHVDLTISVGLGPIKRIKLAEAKIYNGPKYHIDGITQLLHRYTTGRELSGLLLNYVRKKNIKAIKEKLIQSIDDSKPEQLIGTCQEHPLKWSFDSTHGHSSGEEHKVSHIGINLYIEE